MIDQEYINEIIILEVTTEEIRKNNDYWRFRMEEAE